GSAVDLDPRRLRAGRALLEGPQRAERRRPRRTDQERAQAARRQAGPRLRLGRPPRPPPPRPRPPRPPPPPRRRLKKAIRGRWLPIAFRTRGGTGGTRQPASPAAVRPGRPFRAG